jgi:hypothetical protein
LPGITRATDGRRTKAFYHPRSDREGAAQEGGPSLTALEHELAHGYELLAGGVLVHPDANPPIIADDQDPDFFHAIIEGDDGAIPDTNLADLTAWRGFVLNDGPVPPQGVRRRRPRQ